MKQKIQFEAYRPSELYTIGAESQRVISVPVQLKDGDFLIIRTTKKTWRFQKVSIGQCQNKAC